MTDEASVDAAVRVNAVMPSLVDTPLVHRLTNDAEVLAEYLPAED